MEPPALTTTLPSHDCCWSGSGGGYGIRNPFITPPSLIMSNAWRCSRNSESRSVDIRAGEIRRSTFSWARGAIREVGTRPLEAFAGVHHGSDPNIPCGEKDDTALHVAVRRITFREIVRWLLDASADPNRADADGLVPVEAGASRGQSGSRRSARRSYGARTVELGKKERFFAAAFSTMRKGPLRFFASIPRWTTHSKKKTVSL